MTSTDAKTQIEAFKDAGLARRVLAYLDQKKLMKLQKTCKAWYNDEIPTIVKPLRIDYLAMKVDAMLKKFPDFAPAGILSKWKQLGPLSVAEFIKKAPPHAPVELDPKLLEFK